MYVCLYSNVLACRRVSVFSNELQTYTEFADKVCFCFLLFVFNLQQQQQQQKQFYKVSVVADAIEKNGKDDRQTDEKEMDRQRDLFIDTHVWQLHTSDQYINFFL